MCLLSETFGKCSEFWKILNSWPKVNRLSSRWENIQYICIYGNLLSAIHIQLKLKVNIFRHKYICVNLLELYSSQLWLNSQQDQFLRHAACVPIRKAFPPLVKCSIVIMLNFSIFFQQGFYKSRVSRVGPLKGHLSFQSVRVWVCVHTRRSRIVCPKLVEDEEISMNN